MLHGHLGDDLRGWGRGEGGEDEGPGVDDLRAGGVDYFDGLAGEEGCRDAVAGGDGCWCHFLELKGLYRNFLVRIVFEVVEEVKLGKTQLQI